MFPPERGCLAVMWPLASHPTNKNEVIAWDLSADPSELATLDADTMRLRLYTRSADLPEGVTRLPIKTVHLNKSPMVVGNLKTLRPELAQRWGLDLDQAMRHAHTARDLPDMSAIWAQVFQRAPSPVGADPEHDLYGGFVGNGDRRRLNALRLLSPQELALDKTGFDDERLAELVFRWRARNWPESLSAEEQGRWQSWCRARLLDGAAGSTTVERWCERTDALAEAASERGDERAEFILGELYDWVGAITPER